MAALHIRGPSFQCNNTANVAIPSKEEICFVVLETIPFALANESYAVAQSCRSPGVSLINHGH